MSQSIETDSQPQNAETYTEPGPVEAARITSSVPPNNPRSVNETSPAQWHLNFVIPELKMFSHYVSEAVNTGVVTARARQEIVQVLHTYITAHIVNPTSEQYKQSVQSSSQSFQLLRIEV